MNARIFIPPHVTPLVGDEAFANVVKKFLQNPLATFSEFSYENPIASNRSLGVMFHVVSDPVGWRQVLVENVDDFRKSPLALRVLKSANKEGLLSVSGEQWRAQRRTIAPVFRPRHMGDLAPSVTEVCEGFVQHLKNGPSEIDLQESMSNLTFDILAKTLLGDPSGAAKAQIKRDSELVLNSVGKMRIDDMIYMPEWVPRLIGPIGFRALTRMRKSARDMIKRSEANKDADDLVSLLTHAHDPKTGATLTETEKVDNLIGFFVAGHETTALTLTWALYLLGRHPDVLAKLRAEVDAVCEADPIGAGHAKSMPYTRAVIDETMRLYPPAPILPRQAVSDTQILGRDVKKGDVILLATYVMHRTNRLWNDPNLFRPERFIENPKLNRGKDKFMPFGAGPRVCVGASFAILEAMIALPTLVRAIDFAPDPGHDPEPVMTITLRPKGGISTMISPRPVGA